MGKRLPHLSGYQQWQYTAKSLRYQWSTVVKAKNIAEARQRGRSEAIIIFGNHARITFDEVIPLG